MGQRLVGVEKTADMTLAQWAQAADLDWSASIVPSFSRIDGEMVEVENERHIHRSDNNEHLGTCTKVWKPVQPLQTLEWFEAYVAHDPHFVLDCAGCLQGGKRIFATAKYNGDFKVAGDKHVMHLMMTTSFDQTGATINIGNATRWVCMNQLPTALARAKKGKGGVVKTRHSSKFDAKRVVNELADIVESFNDYKAMGDAMVQVHMTNEANDRFVRRCLGIEDGEVKTRAQNMINEVNHAYDLTVREGTEPNTAWAMLNAITRYVDHDRGTRDTGDGEDRSRFFSAHMGSGAAMKAKAVSELYAHNDGELANLLKVPMATRTERPFAQPLVTR